MQPYMNPYTAHVELSTFRKILSECLHHPHPPPPPPPPITSPIATAAATGHFVDYDPLYFDIADAKMFGSGGNGANMDFICPFNDPAHHHHCYRRLEDGDNRSQNKVHESTEKG
ncbi:hypothetical protein YC2023_048242 [Brassica napus]